MVFLLNIFGIFTKHFQYFYQTFSELPKFQYFSTFFGCIGNVLRNYKTWFKIKEILCPGKAVKNSVVIIDPISDQSYFNFSFLFVFILWFVLIIYMINSKANLLSIFREYHNLIWINICLHLISNFSISSYFLFIIILLLLKILIPEYRKYQQYCPILLNTENVQYQYRNF